ncbi:hybrid sensor histidine kinase/response regulator [Aggregatilinea lenta]|uniref:hybrid sensor histidine kinase/response regulator n=1 Tax=Aggregatilinea lenta TaxID=913108 RepID=UPI000E5B27CB|nr:hybrid sensor histidine kinase/response regulator [Aggregatilinea lenta]
MPKILVIEDEGVLREEIVAWLHLEGYEAFGAADGVEGVAAAFKLRPDLIICDITMPRLDGYGVLLELHSNPATATVPFIFMTARVAHDDMRHGMSLGADDYVTKPFSLVDLLQTVESRLQRKRMQEQMYQQEIEQLQKAINEEHEQRAFKAKLVAMFSHDFRNPLSSIMSSNSLLRDYYDRMDKTSRDEHFSYIDSSVRQLIQMLDDMLLVGQMDSGNLTLKSEILNVGVFFQGVVDEFRVLYRKSHEIQFECPDSLVAVGDSRLLRQIASNLISNAVKYSPQGGEIAVTVERGDSVYSLSVADQGIGIPDEELSQLFEAFRRASNVGKVRGTGLGLAIVRQAADLHEGKVEIESQLGTGTCVCVTLPTCPGNSDAEVRKVMEESGAL